MRVPIPNDWDGETWRCVQIQWPDSDLWAALLTGFLTTPMRGRFWDERTGIIKDAQEIGRQIYNENFPLLPCDGSLPDEPDSSGDFGGGFNDSAICAIGEVIMSMCSLPYGAMRWQDGVLQYRYCGEWYDVEGVPGYAPSLPQPGDDDAPEIDPEVWDTPTPCSKAVAICDVLFGVIDELLDSAESPETPAGAVSNVRSRYPQINFGDANLLNAYLHAAQVRTLGYSSEVEAPTFQQKMLCNVSLQISEGNQGLTETERSSVQSAISSVCRQDFTVVTHPTVFASVELMYVLAYRAIGASDTVSITSYATPTGAEDCTCPSGEAEYTGEMAFTGAYSAPQHPDWVDSVEIGNQGRYVDIEWTTPPGYSKNEDNFSLTVAVSGTVNSYILKVQALDGASVPLNSQTTEEYCENPDFWTQPDIGVPTSLDSWATIGNARYNTVELTSPLSVNTVIESYFADCPSNQTGDDETYKIRFEIVDVNGVSYP